MKFDQLLKIAGNEYAEKVSDGLESDIIEYVDTGSYAFNALLSGTIYGGYPGNKISALAGEASTGKTYVALGVAEDFLRRNPEGAVFYFETESALTSEILTSRGIDTKRFYVIPVVTIEEFRTQVMKVIDAYLATPVEDRKPLQFFLDSLGNASTEKEIKDIAEGKNTRDMTRAQLIRGTFRALALKLGRAKIPMMLTNHTYEVVGAYVPTQEMSGGGGLQYAASTIVFLSKKKAKDEKTNEITGNIIVCTCKKSRFTKENMKVEMMLDYQKGLDRYYGLLPIVEKYGIWKLIGPGKFEINGKPVWKKEILRNPEAYYTEDALKLIDEACKKEFMFGTDSPALVDEDADVEQPD